LRNVTQISQISRILLANVTQIPQITQILLANIRRGRDKVAEICEIKNICEIREICVRNKIMKNCKIENYDLIINNLLPPYLLLCVNVKKIKKR
jgi:hypothetical protein